MGNLRLLSIELHVGFEPVQSSLGICRATCGSRARRIRHRLPLGLHVIAASNKRRWHVFAAVCEKHRVQIRVMCKRQCMSVAGEGLWKTSLPAAAPFMCVYVT